MSSFAGLSVSSEILTVLEELDFKSPTPIQQQSIPILLSGKDLIAQSKTGSGKTVAFSIPLLQKIDLDNRAVQALVLCPTRELSTQVAREIRKLGRRYEGLRVLLLVGGQPVREQLQALELGGHIVVGTPGRVLDVILRERFSSDQLKLLILDEADKMLDMGFEEEINAILGKLPRVRQTALFSATFPESITNLSQRIQKRPEKIVIERGTHPQAQAEGGKEYASDSGDDNGQNSIQQYLYEIEPPDKISFLMRVLQKHPTSSTLIFCNQKATVETIVTRILELKGSCAALHGDLEQRERDRVMAMFRNGSLRILVATDVAARGLDIEDLGLVINYDFPQQPEVYIHRIGRTGRAGKRGEAILLARANEDVLKVLELEKVLSKKMERPVLGFNNQFGLAQHFREPAFHTLQIMGGRKDKLRPGDILGALTSATSGIQGSEIGKIELFDQLTYVGVRSHQAALALKVLREGRIKGKKFSVRMLA